MKILQSIKKVRSVIADEQVNNDISPTGKAVNDAAMAALFGGIKSDAWKSYMAVFADNPDQLTRLTEEVDGEEPYLKQMRAYVVTSAVCDPGTNLNIAGKVDFKIDGTNSPMNPDVRSDLDDDTIVNLRPNLLKTVRNTP